MKVALLQFNPTVGAVEQNAARITQLARDASAQGAQIAVTSELALLGYPPRDLLERSGFLEQVEAASARLVDDVPEELTLVFGSVAGPPAGRELLRNQAIVARRGTIVGRATKQLLPAYDVFDETRHFEPGDSTLVLPLAGARVALTICEDAWTVSPRVAPRYSTDPLAAVRAAKADLLINLSASPFTLDKLDQRPEMFASIARQLATPVVFVNQVGGNDELVFDGRSAVWQPGGELLAQAKMFEEDLLIVDLAGSAGTGQAMPACSSEEAVYRALVLGIADYTRKCGFQRVVIGLSGGIDSALTAVLAADALGRENVLGVAMPTRYSSTGSLEDAQALARNLGIGYQVVDIDRIFGGYMTELEPTLNQLVPPSSGDVTLENLQARIRGATLMAISNRTGAMVLTTGNKSEVAVGYCTLYGDMVGGLAAISDVPKTMVYRISRWLNRDLERIPHSSITKPPSAELRPGQLDADSLPDYDLLDAVLELYVEDHLSARQIVERGFSPDLVNRIIRLVKGSEYKRRQAAPGLIVTRKAFGVGRRLPVAQGFGESV